MIPAKHAQESADLVTSSEDYARRFSGPVGCWMIQVQSNITKEMLGNFNYQNALDVGGGHGQLIAPLAELGIKTTILGSSPECESQTNTDFKNHRCTFIVGSLTEIPCPARSFDLVTSIRLISHCENWPRLIAELCRISKRGVLIDYPPLVSSNIIAPVTFRIKKLIEGNTRPFSIFQHREIEEEFAKHNFVLVSRMGEFLFPMALHRLAKNRSFSQQLERLGDIASFRQRFGSPTLAHFTRKQ